MFLLLYDEECQQARRTINNETKGAGNRGERETFWRVPTWERTEQSGSLEEEPRRSLRSRHPVGPNNST